MAPGLRCPAARGIFPDQGSNLCPHPPCIGRRVLNHRATREVPLTIFEFLSGVIDTGQAAKEGRRRKDDSAGLIQAREVVIINYQVEGEEGETG